MDIYAEMHGLHVDSSPLDGWYHDQALPIRLIIPESWPLWPIERDAAVVLHTLRGSKTLPPLLTWPDELLGKMSATIVTCVAPPDLPRVLADCRLAHSPRRDQYGQDGEILVLRHENAILRRQDLWGSRIGVHRLTFVLHMLDACVVDTMEAMTASVVYLLLRQVLQMLT